MNEKCYHCNVSTKSTIICSCEKLLYAQTPLPELCKICANNICNICTIRCCKCAAGICSGCICVIPFCSGCYHMYCFECTSYIKPNDTFMTSLCDDCVSGRRNKCIFITFGLIIYPYSVININYHILHGRVESYHYSTIADVQIALVYDSANWYFGRDGYYVQIKDSANLNEQRDKLLRDYILVIYQKLRLIAAEYDLIVDVAIHIIRLYAAVDRKFILFSAVDKNNQNTITQIYSRISLDKYLVHISRNIV